MLSIILAAGKGTRMKSELTKVLHPLAGKPMLSHVVETLKQIDDNKIICVVGHQGERVKKTVGSGINYVEQKRQLGTGHAVMQVKEFLAGYEGSVLIVCGDTPLLRTDTLIKFIAIHKEKNSDLSILTASLAEPGSYGRIVRSKNGETVERIVEAADASRVEKEIREVNSGVYCFRAELLEWALESL
ncbi:MAG: sugar phosphate nucleotidyltransferase, partial [Halanaerobiales bacterium]